MTGIVAASLQDLMDTLTGYAEEVGYRLKSPTFLPQPSDGCVLSGVDLRVRMGMFDSRGSQNDSKHLALLASLDGFSQLVKRAVGAIEPSNLL